ncbi:MAG: 4-amino-4-deoxy-L-arabinose transferase [Propionibacteriaceae bacterium]|nr:4-amino-4-deoxy-L-arabinose transferase [Propionibacteriaceae bacterium]
MTAIERLLTHATSTMAAPGVSRVVAVDGPSGAGKTTFAEQVADELVRRTGMRPQVVHMDDIFPGWDGLADAVDLVAGQVLEPLSKGESGRFRRWDWAQGTRAEWVEVPVADWIVLEGVGCGSRRCRSHLAALAWVEADKAVRMARGIERDGEAFRPHWQRWAVQEQALFAAEDTRGHADVILRT